MQLSRLSRRTVLKGVAAASAALSMPAISAPADPVYLDDASQLNRTRVFSHWIARVADQAELVKRLRLDLKQAAAAGRPVAIGGARHSMGGQSIPTGGQAYEFDLGAVIETDSAARTYRMQAGGRWLEVVRQLDALGFSPAVMQSNADFSAGGTLSVNAHGWAVPYGPFGQTVRAFRLMTVDGEIVDCAPDRNAELFSAAIGGYGLIGIVLDMDLDMVENTMLQASLEVLPAERFAERLVAAVDAGDHRPRMAYGRLSLSRRAFMTEAILVTYRPAATPAGGLPKLGAGGIVAGLSREIFRAQTDSNLWKAARWDIERAFTPGNATRNTILNDPVANLAGRDRSRTDILHEYFVPPARFPEFLAACRDVIPASGQDLLNVTLRFIEPDRRSLLAYARERTVSAVMLFSQPMTAAADTAMRQMTELLIERILALGGRYYLPYRLHARPDQLRRAYPDLDAFVALKTRVDPAKVFRNRLWDTYLANAADAK